MEEALSQSKFPHGWDEERVRRVLAHYEAQTEEDAILEDGGMAPSERHGRHIGNLRRLLTRPDADEHATPGRLGIMRL
jgi:hypothetical protein